MTDARTKQRFDVVVTLKWNPVELRSNLVYKWTFRNLPTQTASWQLSAKWQRAANVTSCDYGRPRQVEFSSNTLFQNSSPSWVWIYHRSPRFEDSSSLFYSMSVFRCDSWTDYRSKSSNNLKIMSNLFSYTSSKDAILLVLSSNTFLVLNSSGLTKI